MKYIFIAIIKFYQKFISPLKKPCCRFSPTCSAYAVEAFKERGAFVGLGLTVWRVLRCNPLNKGDYYDPVPKRKSKKKRKESEYLSEKVKGKLRSE